ncbi:hypothetical protein PSN45_004555 [Yamadazyma tenuis]|uniref:NAD(P)-binding protein n=1 Tax=Candida tenuis (strain ATCC 10573 / BCRC 21748 / CBS 615 / JCM 9827 / NBRC 10315 / NRRL Y-1498 / VKM Y-70) TaxID=590646 RepID=G3B5A2_CANTC|nr:NAD(P)-binding protein [Yamadazyma tenuis ATCC 10573]XP_006687366.1 uncharacterized protein CANTEDRAFT_114491 [Yamadazyma tenuis ATCC 10573]EGV63572.1 NAD(P)-binding protein [Yamadazyma tenuis ATCC 10573]EGV63573.1 hypothetical protein CANTEDRAFT_114491 [Yamadazyma tenuis ATCC 10573]WEJ97009.1 hypothetical protein PSN45_004555 [Yamadazyma tenuis]
MSFTYLVVGASRGIGYAYVKVLSAVPTNLVIATARDHQSAKKLESLGSNVKTILIDMQDPYAKFEAAFKVLDTLAPNGVDVFIHNAGISSSDASKSSLEFDADQYQKILDVNVGGPAKAYKAAYPYIFKGKGTKKIAFVSSTVGQVGWEVSPGGGQGFNAYGASKAALNHLGVQIAKENAGSDVDLVKHSVTVLLCPGLVATDMAKGFEGAMPPEVSVAASLAVISKTTAADSGKFYGHSGESQPYSIF